MESVKLQLELNPRAITIRTNLWEGVLTAKTFEGDDCYSQMLDFIKQVFPEEKFINAMIIVVD
jgi:hypothetical protein